jgi:type IV pilus assembly protein PilA
MIDWYYHAPGEGRVGPFSAEELRKRFHERRLQHDTLVWHEGMREWQPLERMAEQLDLGPIRRDTSAPPPIPGNVPPAMPGSALPPMTASAHSGARSKYTRAPLQQKKTLSTGAIALILVAALGIPALLVFGSMTLSSYRKYATHAQNAGQLAGISQGIRDFVADYRQRTGRCLTNQDPRMTKIRDEFSRRMSVAVSFGAIDDGCMFELSMIEGGKPMGSKTLRFEGHAVGDGFVWDCSGGTLPPVECRATH